MQPIRGFEFGGGADGEFVRGLDGGRRGGAVLEREGMDFVDCFYVVDGLGL